MSCTFTYQISAVNIFPVVAGHSLGIPCLGSVAGALVEVSGAASVELVAMGVVGEVSLDLSSHALSPQLLIGSGAADQDQAQQSNARELHVCFGDLRERTELVAG